MTVGTVYGVGLGPGDPELMSVKADRLLRQARNVAFFRKVGRPGQARGIVEGLLVGLADEDRDAQKYAGDCGVTGVHP